MLIIVVSLTLLAPAFSHDPFNTLKTRAMPTISNSLVNLGKMDISFYYNGKPTGTRSKPDMFPGTSIIPKPPVHEEPCPCSDFRNAKNFNPFLTNPSELINKLLMSNDLFNNNPMTSTFCCDSKEHVHEETVFIDLSPSKPIKAVPRTGPVALPPFIYEHAVPSKSNPFKSKTLEIFFFPKKKDLASIDYLKMIPKMKEIKKDDIQIVGDKKPQNDINKFLLPMAPTVVADTIVVGKKQDASMPTTTEAQKNTV